MKLFASANSTRWLSAGAIALLVLGTNVIAQDAGPAAEADAASELAPLTYTSGQAVGGKTNYQRLCASCHGNNLEGTAGPALSGANFEHWVGGPALDLFDFIQQQMPAGAGGTLTDAQVATIMAHMAKVNGLEQGTKPMPTTRDGLEGIQFGQ